MKITKNQLRSLIKEALNERLTAQDIFDAHNTEEEVWMSVNWMMHQLRRHNVDMEEPETISFIKSHPGPTVKAAEVLSFLGY